MSKKIFLTMSEELYSELEKQRKEHGFMTIQELINDLVRRSLFGTPKITQNQGGRPKKFEFEDYFAGPPGSALK